MADSSESALDQLRVRLLPALQGLKDHVGNDLVQLARCHTSNIGTFLDHLED